jgi:hypothetical protein
MHAQITLRRGSLYLTAALCRRYFDGLESVILMRRNADLAILPVRHTAAGGYLLKLRNSAGDRVVNAMDFFTSNGIDEAGELTLPVLWNREIAGLIAKNLFKTAN